MSQGSTAAATNGRHSSRNGNGAGAQQLPAPDRDTNPIPLEEIERAVRSIRFGSVHLVIQDGVVLQIDKTEKLRLR